MKRISADECFLRVAEVHALRGTCARRQVGAVLTDTHGHIIGSGYNGRQSGAPHCSEGHQCAGANAPSGTALDACEAIHAEQNALMQCKDIHSVYTCYSVASPCIHCVKMLLNTSCQRIVFRTEYPHPASRDLWVNAGRQWVHLP